MIIMHTGNSQASKSLTKKRRRKIFIIWIFSLSFFFLKYRQLYDHNATATARLQRKKIICIHWMHSKSDSSRKRKEINCKCLHLQLHRFSKFDFLSLGFWSSIATGMLQRKEEMENRKCLDLWMLLLFGDPKKRKDGK